VGKDVKDSGDGSTTKIFEKATHTGESVGPAFEPETSVLRGTSFHGFGRDANPARLDIKNGRIIRTRPIHYNDEGYGSDYRKPWKIEVKGKMLEPPEKTLITPLALGFKKRVYSPNRVKYPLIRVDWDPNGQRNPQNRGKSKYRRISWDEATDIIAAEILRVQEKYGYFAILAQGDAYKKVSQEKTALH